MDTNISNRNEITVLTQHVVRLGNGVAISSSDLSEFKAVRDRFTSVAQFSRSILAPVTIMSEVPRIEAMNLNEPSGAHGAQASWKRKFRYKLDRGAKRGEYISPQDVQGLPVMTTS